MEEQNAKQKEFMKGLLHSMYDAVIISEKIITALEIGGVINPDAAFDYLKALNAFLDAGMKIIWTTHFAYGENEKTIAKETLNRSDINN